MQVFTEVDLGRYLLNTLLFTVITTGLMVFVTILAAFAFARMQFRGKNLLFTAFLALMMIPPNWWSSPISRPSRSGTCATLFWG